MVLVATSLGTRKPWLCRLRLNKHCCFFTSSSSTPLIYLIATLMSTDVWVLSYEHLKGRPRSDQALTLLQWVASRVKPIMRKHGWRLPVLAEFFPDSPGLIGTLSCISCTLLCLSETRLNTALLGLSTYIPLIVH
jgi:hypothetical protein